MTISESFANALKILIAMLKINLLFLALMSIFRTAFFIRFGESSRLEGFHSDTLKAFFLGFRFDLSVIGYIQTLAFLSLLVFYFLKNESAYGFARKFFVWYFFVLFSVVSIILGIDIGFYSYFQDHINILIFGVIHDDTIALFNTILKNYNVPFILVLFVLYEAALFVFIKKVFALSQTVFKKSFSKSMQFFALFFVFALSALFARGGVSMYPLGVMDTAISKNMFVNQLSINGVHSFYRAVELYALNKKDGYNLIEQMGYKNKIEEAFKVHLQKSDIDTNNLISNITYRIDKNETIEAIKPHVVVVVMESFGTFLTEYQSSDFDVLGGLKKHFDEDIVFRNFTSSENGTIGSIESLVVNLPFRLGSDHFAESKYLRTPIKSSPAFLYKQKGYETSFVYGGNVGWRDIDKFFSKQGFDNVDGDSEIEGVIKDKTKKYKDDWGIFDGYVFEYVKSKLQNAKTPQFIMVMTTTNHPPYAVEPDYKPKPLNVPSALQKRITGAKELVDARFVAYQYANEKAGEFLGEIKNSDLKEKTIVAITGDHNFGGVINFSNEEHLKFRGVPFYIYAPKELKPKDYDKEVFGSHKDIMPTLYALSLSDISHISIGKNMLDRSLEHYSFNASGFVAGKDGAVLYAKPSVYFNWDGDLLKNDENVEKYKKIVEYYKATLSVTEYFVQSHLKKED